MKTCSRLIFGVCLAIGLAIAFTACSSAPVVYDKSVPLEQSSTLIIKLGKITLFNGKKVSWNGYNGFSWGQKFIIPAGTHEFILEFEQRSATGKAMEGVVTMKHEFLPGHSYNVLAALTSISGRNAMGIIIDEEELQNELKPNSENPDASPFEGKWVDVKDEGNQLILCGSQYIRIYKGKNDIRGFFSYTKNSVYLHFLAKYAKGMWEIDEGLMQFGGANYVYDGSSLKIGKYEYRKK